MKNILKLLYLLAIILFVGCSEDSQIVQTTQTNGNSYTILDAFNKTPIPAVDITTYPTGSNTQSNSKGVFQLPISDTGLIQIKAVKTGYNSTVFSNLTVPDSQKSMTFEMTPYGPEFALSSSFLDFGAATTTMTITLSNKSKLDTVKWNCAADVKWFSITPLDGILTTANTVVSITVDRSKMPLSDNETKLTFISNAGTKVITIYAAKTNASLLKIYAHPDSVPFNSENKTIPLIICNIKSGNYSYSINRNADWIVLSKYGGIIPGYGADTIIISTNKTGLNVGKYSGLVTISSDYAKKDIPVTMIIDPYQCTPSVLSCNTISQTLLGLSWTKNTDVNFGSYKLYASDTKPVTENCALICSTTNRDSVIFYEKVVTTTKPRYYALYTYSKFNSASFSFATNIPNVPTGVFSPLPMPSRYSYGGKNCLQVVNENKLTYITTNAVYQYNYGIWSLIDSITGNSLTAVWIGDDGKGFATSINGILYTIDNSKLTATRPTAFSRATDIVGRNFNSLWVSGDLGVYHFNGSSFSFSLLADNILDLDYISESSIWAIATNGAIYYYNGTTWTQKGTVSANVTGIKGISNDEAWITSTTSIFHYNKGTIKERDGLSNIYDFTSFDVTTDTENDIFLFSGSAGNMMQLLSTGWKQVISVGSPIGCSKFLDHHVGFVVTSNGTIYRYSDQ